MSATSLTERYVWSVTRQLPQDSGPDVARELRATLEETIEGKIAAGATPQEAERAALAELGDPDVLAREYGGRPNHLIGPAFYPDWVRLVRALLAVVLPIVVVATFLTQFLATDRSLGALVGEVAVVLLHTAVHLVFWSTLVFALVERSRSEADRERLLSGWTPENLVDTDVPWRRVGSWEMTSQAAFGIVVLLLVLWQLGGVGERGVQVLDPALALGWKAVLVALLAGDVAITLWAWAKGRWSMPLSVANVAGNVASALVLVWLVVNDRLLTDLPAVLGEKFGWDTDWNLSTSAVVLGVVVVCGWDAAASVVRVRRDVHARRHLGDPAQEA